MSARAIPREEFFKDRLIPRELMPQVIDLIKSNILDFLKDAELILTEGRDNHALVSVQFAIEEFGKILMLRNALKSSETDPVRIDKRVFTSHSGKIEEAWKILDPNLQKVFFTFWDPEMWKPEMGPQTAVSHDTRCECAFVDFFEGKPFINQYVMARPLYELISHIRDKLPET